MLFSGETIFAMLLGTAVAGGMALVISGKKQLSLLGIAPLGTLGGLALAFMVQQDTGRLNQRLCERIVKVEYRASALTDEGVKICKFNS